MNKMIAARKTETAYFLGMMDVDTMEQLYNEWIDHFGYANLVGDEVKAFDPGWTPMYMAEQLFTADPISDLLEFLVAHYILDVPEVKLPTLDETMTQLESNFRTLNAYTRDQIIKRAARYFHVVNPPENTFMQVQMDWLIDFCEGNTQRALAFLRINKLVKGQASLNQLPVVGVQEAWIACGGNPGIIATKSELLGALQVMNEAEDEVEETAFTIKEIYQLLGLGQPQRSVNKESTQRLLNAIGQQIKQTRDASWELTKVLAEDKQRQMEMDESVQGRGKGALV